MKKKVSRHRDVVVRSLGELRRFARAFARTVRGGEVIALSGQLGAGKTTFVRMLGKALSARERITSPTFTLMHLHALRKRKGPTLLVHIDAYRLRGSSAFVDIGALDYLGRSDTVAVIEWPERVRRALPPQTQWINIAPGGMRTERRIRVAVPGGGAPIPPRGKLPRRS